MAGFFGLEWPNNATLELIIEERGFNNSLAGYKNCPNSNTWRNAGGNNASLEWVDIYLRDATERIQGLIEGFKWTIADTYAAQSLCPYETVSCISNLVIAWANEKLCRSRMDILHSAASSPTPNGNPSNTLKTSTSLALQHSNLPPAAPSA